MANNYIAIMLPEFRDPHNEITGDDWTIDRLPTREELKIILDKLDNFITFFKGQESDLIYDGKNIEAFLFPIDVLDTCYPPTRRFIRSILRGIQNWRRNRISNSDARYICGHLNISDEIRAELFERKLRNAEDSFIIAFHNDDFKQQSWEIVHTGKSYRIDSMKLNIKDVFDWEVGNHKPLRIYNHNPKHGENGIGAHPDNKGEKVSVLLCSKDHASNLLQFAIGESGFDTLYYYDSDYDSYIEFKAEIKHNRLPENTAKRNYHAYHIDDLTLLPKEIIEKIKFIIN